MCYSAQIEADYRRFVHEYGAIMSLDDFTRMVVKSFAKPQDVRRQTVTTPAATTCAASDQYGHTHVFVLVDASTRL